MKALTTFFLLLMIFLLPLISSLYNLGYEQSKVLFFLIALSLVMICASFSSLKDIKFVWTPVNLTATTFFIMLFVNSMLGIDPLGSFIGRPPYYQGFMIYLFLYIFFLLISFSKISVKSCALIILASAFLVSLLAIKDFILLNFFNIPVSTYAGRVVSSFGQPNFYSGYILLSLPFLIKFYPNNIKLKFWWFIFSLVLVLGIFISGSRIAIFLSIGLILSWFYIKLGFWSRKVVWVLFLSAVAVGLLISFQLSSGLIEEEFLKPQDKYWLIHNSPEKRVYIWPVVFQLVTDKPFLGYGLENLEQAFSGYVININTQGTKHPEYFGVKNLVVDRAHNYPLDLLIFSGFLGFSAWYILVWTLFRKSRGILLVALLTYLVWIQFQNQSIVHLAYFWLLAGLINNQS